MDGYVPLWGARWWNYFCLFVCLFVCLSYCHYYFTFISLTFSSLPSTFPFYPLLLSSPPLFQATVYHTLKTPPPSWSTRGKLRNHLVPLLIDMYGEGCLRNLSNLAKESDDTLSFVATNLYQVSHRYTHPFILIHSIIY